MKLVDCPKCSKTFRPPDHQTELVCTHCGFNLDQRSMTADAIKERIELGKWDDLSPELIDKHARFVVITTTHSVAGRQVEREIEVISAECVYGVNLFRDFFMGVRDIFGGRSASSQKVLRDARKTCLTELRREALMVGADAVIGVDLDYSEISGGGKSGLLLLVATGTAVKLRDRGGC